MIEIYAKANACLSITRMSTRTCQWAGQPQGLMMMRAGQGRLWAEAGAVVTEQACLRLRPALHPSLPSFIIILFIVAILIIAMTIIIITIILPAYGLHQLSTHPSHPLNTTPCPLQPTPSFKATLQPFLGTLQFNIESKLLVETYREQDEW